MDEGRTHKVFDLGNGLELWAFHVDDLMEQDVNARTMKKEAFDRLAATIKKDQRIESLPLCALTEKGLEIVSGHHRVRAMRTAGVTEGYCLVDVTGLPRYAIAAKQLAHNSIQGYDDPQLLARIFESIGDVDARLEAFIDPKMIEVHIPRIKVDDVDLGMRFETVIIMFIPWERGYVKEALAAIEQELVGTQAHEAWLVDIEFFDNFKKLGRQITKEYDIHSMSTALYKMAELARQQMGVQPEWDEEDRVPIRDLAGSFYVPRDAATVMEEAIARMVDAGEITAEAKWRAFELWAAEYLAGAPLLRPGLVTDGVG